MKNRPIWTGMLHSDGRMAGRDVLRSFRVDLRSG